MEEVHLKTKDLEEKIKKNLDRIKRKAFLVLSALVVFVFLIILGQLFSPHITSAILRFVWILAFASVFIFFGIGILVFVGLRKEASRLLDILLEGSLTIIDVVDLLKEIYKTFISLLKDFAVYVAPVFAYLASFVIYYLLMVFYKKIGRNYDVTLITVLITVATIVLASFLNLKSGQGVKDGWESRIKEKFMQSFADSFEILIALFFLTMDSTKLFFLPDNLNVPLNANLGNNDLMIRGFSLKDPPRFTLLVVVSAVSVEIARYALRIISVAKNYLEEARENADSNDSDLIKHSLRKSFNEAKDDSLKFITFTTAIVAVFLAFPRLKLFAMVAASITGLILDFIIPSRLSQKRGNDLLSRIIVKVFKL